MAVHTLRNFMNLQSSDLSNLALEMLDAEDAAFVLVSPGGDIISQTAGAGRLLKSMPLRPVGEVLSERAAQALKFVQTTGGESSIHEDIDGKTYRMEVRPVEQGVLLYFAPMEQQAAHLPANFSRQIVDSLSHILAAVHLMLGSQGEKSERLLDGIRRDSLRIYRGLAHLQFLESDAAPEEAMKLELGDLAELCRSAVERCRAACAARGRTVELTVDAPDACPVVYDRALLLRALLNLLTNALRTPEVSRVCVRLTHGQGRVSIVVADDGPGVPAEQLSRLYHDWARPWDEAGWMEQSMPCGLGLPLVRQVAGWHGGTLLLEPGQEGGTVFRLSFPDDLPPDPPQLGQSLPDDSLDLVEIELSIL